MIVSTYLCKYFPCAFSEKDEEVRDRDDLRRDRNKERQRERNIARAAPDKRSDGRSLSL